MVDNEIQVHIQIFASLRQALGKNSLTVRLPSGATVADLLERLRAEYPTAAPQLARALVAIDHNYADQTQSLAPGDEVAIFPPVSGGTDERGSHDVAMTHAALSAEPIDPLQLSDLVSDPGSGAVVTFSGIVRDNNLGRQVQHLEYEAFGPMAEAKLRQVVVEARERWPAIRGVAVVHRTGHLEIGAMAVLVAVAASHRDDGAFEAARYIIDRTKEVVPIWKKESWADGAEWLEGDYRPQPGE